MTIKRSQWPHSRTLYSCILFIECCQWTRSTSDLFSIVVSVVYNVYYIYVGKIHSELQSLSSFDQRDQNVCSDFKTTIMSFIIRGLLRFKRRRRVAIAESGEQNLYDFAHNKTHTLYATYHPPPPHCRLMPQSSWHVVQVVVVFYFGLCALYTNRRGILRE